MKIIKILFLSISPFIFLFLACLVPNKSKKAFAQNDFCYDHQTINTSQGRFKTDGYYKFPNSNCIFYDDGLWVGGYDKTWKYQNNRRPDWYINGIGYWGIYKIVGDTIKVRYIQTLQSPYNVGEKWFLIEDESKLKCLLFKYDRPITNDDINISRQQFPNGQIYSFVPFDSLPNLNLSWFKRSKWLWCDKVAYETWKASQQQQGD